MSVHSPDTKDFYVTDIQIRTAWVCDEEGYNSRVTEVKLRSTKPLPEQKDLSDWLMMARPELPHFFDVQDARYKISKDGRRLSITYKDSELKPE